MHVLPLFRKSAEAVTAGVHRSARQPACSLAVLLLVGSVTTSLAFTRATRQNAQPGQGPTLAEGSQRERDLAPGQTHTYAVQVAGGEFLHATVTPQGIDVAVALIGPDGRELLTIDLSPDPVVPETIMALAETGGRYAIAVKAAVGGVPAGRYLIRIDARREATAADALRVRAMRNLEAGNRLRIGLQPKAMGQAIEPLEAAWRGFRDVGDRQSEARALQESAANLLNLGNPAGRDQARQALDLYRDQGDDVGIGKCLSVIGTFHERSNEMPDAFRVLTESLVFSRKTGNWTQEAVTLNAIGIAHGRTGEPERAADAFQQAVGIARRLHLDRVQMIALGNLGIATKDLGNYRQSLTYYDESLALVRAAGDRNVEANTLNNIGNLHRILGEHDKALAAHERALVLARDVENAEHEARALNTIGSTHYQLGNFAKALDYHDQSLAIRRRIDDLAGQAASLDGAGLARHRLGDSVGAIEYLNEALRIRRAIAERHRESDTLVHLALVERDRGHVTAALEHVEAAVTLTNSLRQQVISPELRASFVAAEQERYELYIDVLMQLHQSRPDDGFAARALEASEHGRARVLMESLLEARTDIRRGIDAALLERERTYQRRLDEASTRLSRLSSRQSAPKDVEAARAALETLSDEYRQLQVRIRQQSPAYAALTQPPPLTTTEMQRDLVDAGTVLLEYALGEKRSWLWAMTPTGIASFELPPRREIERVARPVYELLTARQLKRRESADDRTARVANADKEWRRHSIALGRMLTGPAAAYLGEAWRGKRLLIVAADILQYVPFSALPDPGREGLPLVVDHEIVNLPSLSVLAAIRQQGDGRVPPSKKLAVLADPVFEADDPRVTAAPRARQDGARPATRGAEGPGVTPVTRALANLDEGGSAAVSRLSRLPFSRQEAREIAALVPVGQRLEATDFQASRATATSAELGDYSLVHFATHGFFNSEHPELSGLVFSLVDRQGRPQDGFLRLQDIYNLRLAAEVVVLSACQTALGKEIRGEGLVGPTRGFMYAGARRVVASLWQVDDLATADLMRAFYRGMLKDGLRPAAALRAAQRELARQPRWASPFYWSAFVLQGEWR